MNVFVDERPKKCSWQSFLKVLEEHLKGAKSVSKKPSVYCPGDDDRHFREPPESSLMATLIFKIA